MKWTKLFATVAVLALLLTLVACGSEAPQTAPDVSKDVNYDKKTEGPGEKEMADISEENPSLGVSSVVGYAANGAQVFLKIDGIDGDCTVAAYSHWIDLIDFSFESTDLDQKGYQLLTFTHKVDGATPKLVDAVKTGKWIRDGKICVARYMSGILQKEYEVSMTNLKLLNTRIGFDPSVSAMVETVEIQVETLTYGAAQ